MSIHIGAEKGAVAESVLMPGDPLRAQFIAENFLENPVRYNAVRGMYGFTGTYKGKRVSVQGSGMGMPSFSIYANELIDFYGCRRLIRVGTCGSLSAQVKVRDVVIATAASTDSNVNRIRFKGLDFAPAASFELAKAAWDEAKVLGLAVKAGGVVSTDSFYSKDPEAWKLWAEAGVLAIEMETAELYTLASLKGVEALAILTVSDSLVTHEATSSEEREKTFKDMMRLALGVA